MAERGERLSIGKVVARRPASRRPEGRKWPEGFVGGAAGGRDGGRGQSGRGRRGRAPSLSLGPGVRAVCPRRVRAGAPGGSELPEAAGWGRRRRGPGGRGRQCCGCSGNGELTPQRVLFCVFKGEHLFYKSQRQRKGPWSLRESVAEVPSLEGSSEGARRVFWEWTAGLDARGTGGRRRGGKPSSLRPQSVGQRYPSR